MNKKRGIKRIVLGICGGIAVYKTADLARKMIKAGLDVYPVMTSHACEFITPLTFDALTGNRTATGLFTRDLPSSIPHIDLARSADLMVIAPATANLIAKMAAGICDDLLSSLLLSTDAPILLAPSMNTRMLQHPATRRNLKILQDWGCRIAEPSDGELACGEEGPGRLAEPAVILEQALKILAEKNA